MVWGKGARGKRRKGKTNEEALALLYPVTSNIYHAFLVFLLLSTSEFLQCLPLALLLLPLLLSPKCKLQEH